MNSHISISQCVTAVAALSTIVFSRAHAEVVKPSNAAAERLFAVEVLPLLKAKCFGCHGDDPDDVKGEYDIRSRAAMLKGGESEEPSIVPGKPDESSLYLAIQWDGLEMPPKQNDRLTAEQIALVRKWIAGGAPWPDEQSIKRMVQEDLESPEGDGVRLATSGGTSGEWTNRRYDASEVWAFQPVTAPAVPNLADNPIDSFVLEKLRQAGVEPTQSADPRTLIRRATFDLLGLPPTPREIDRFVAAWEVDSKRAWSDLIDRLLEDPHYGERWGQHWLDVVRYADTAGFSNDYERSNAWRYRDYVIRSFNRDKPFDQFIIEQLAGDELRPNDPEMKVATGFLRMGPWGTAMIPQEQARQIYLDDVVNSVGQTFLSIPMRCCKCHDHKFDPIPTRDYYRMYATFAATQVAEVPAEFLESENRRGFAENRKLVEALLKYADDDRQRLVNKREAAARQWYADRNMPYLSLEERKDLPVGQKPPRHVGMDHVDEGTLKVREQDVWIWTRRKERYEPLAQSVYNGPDVSQNGRKLRKPNKIDSQWRPASFIYSGGSLDAKGDPVTPGVLSAPGVPVAGATTDDAFAVPDGLQGRRLAFARWVADPSNPLSTRSIVNRIWQHHFGQGIVRTPNNFGAKGDKPTHPELLNWLTSDFVRHDWRIKRLHRLIMMSKTYQRSTHHPRLEQLATVDPNNQLLARFIPRRLSAEELRDGMLMITGELNPAIGGVPVMPEINMEVALQPRMIQFSLAPAYQPSRTPEERNRRTIYAYRVRGQADPFLEVLNQPNPNESCEQRDVATVTPQAFTMMNSDLMTDRSIALARRVQKHSDDTSAQVHHAFELTFGRSPNDDQLRRLVAYVNQMKRYHQQHQPTAIEYPTNITRSLVEEFSGQPFEYNEWLPALDDFTPDAKPWTVGATTRALADVCLLFFNSNEFVYVY